MVNGVGLIARASRAREKMLASTAVLAVVVGSGGLAWAEQQDFTIQPQAMGPALVEFAQQADIEVLYHDEDVANLTTGGVTGASSRDEALDRLLKGSGLRFNFEADDLIVVRPAAATAGSGRIRVNSNTHHLDNGDQLAQMSEARRQTRVAHAGGGASLASLDEGDFGADAAVEEMIVTGTQIRGAAPAGSPVFVVDREEILSSGVSTAQDFIQLLPQNFGGGSNVDAALGLPNDVNSAFNGGGAGTIGSSVNLRGLGSGSTLVLLNGRRMAPSSGIGDFVDISLIPASAIERIEILTDGASSIYGADAVAGVVNFILRDDFDGVEAAFRYGTVTEGQKDEYRASISAGTNWNTGNAIFVYEYLNQEDLAADDRSFSQDAPLPNDLLPGQERHSVLASASQEITEDLEVSADFAFSRRESQKDFADAFGRVFAFNPTSENFNVSAGGSWRVARNWFLDFSGTYSDVHSEVEQSGDLQSLREIDSTVWTADAIASGSVLSLPGGDLKLAIGSHYRRESFTNFSVTRDALDNDADRDIYAFFGEAFIPIIGPNNALPGVERLELNVSGRFEDFSDFGSTANPKVGILWAPFDALRLRGSYSTSFNPPPLGRVGAADLTATALRTSFINAAFGLTPADPSIADVVVLFLSGTADDLEAESSRAFTAGFDFNQQWEQHNFTVTATWFDINFENRLGSTPVPGGASFFDAHNIAFDNPALFPEGTIVFSPSQSDIADLLDSLDEETIFGGEDPFDAEVINSTLVVRNLARTSVSGFDFDAEYTHDFDTGTLSIGIAGTFLQNFKQQGAISAPLIEQVDTLFNPVDLKLRGHVGFTYNGLAANVFVNYVDDYRIDNTPDAEKIESWTTVDISISYSTQERFDHAILNNTTVRLSVLNLFDEDPPATPSDPNFGIFGFDPTNASPLNRFAAVELSKAF